MTRGAIGGDCVASLDGLRYGPGAHPINRYVRSVFFMQRQHDQGQVL